MVPGELSNVFVFVTKFVYTCVIIIWNFYPKTDDYLMMDSSKPPSSYLTLLDEISLEGLRGLTFPSLWIRLNDRDRYLASLNKPTVFGFDNSNELSKLKDFVLNVCLKESEKGNCI